MDDDVRWGLLAPPWLRRVPADLAAVVVLTLLTVAAVFLPVVRETPLRVVLGLPFVLFVPGYALVAALFPERGAEPIEDDETDEVDSSGITGLERVALSFGVSIAVVPLVGLVLNFTPFGIRLVPIVVSLTALVLALTAVATRRRLALSADERFSVPWREWIRAGKTELLEPETRTDGALNVLLVVSLVLAVSSVGYAVAVPKQGESFTEFYLLTENDEGELVADGYPTEFVAGQSQSLVVGVGNQEHRQQAYTVVVELHDVEVENNSTRVLDRERLRTFDLQIEHNETWQQPHSVAPETTGERLRLTYMLYQGSPPATPTTENAYRELHLWVNVTAQ
ncbi:hypothetical protein C2R22_13705 [Salinigranum rubrum]|uniref:DUF1616 domain-containing protein n=1 Tax=Salinigranum rubrum TaxID=755307 RepID=A0A2I8VKU7_9EURY|nr:DUF1616 domain-containing protein [Salinigranum rubrum]AUV82563.1 hypothetical protein C2R22_13705 [Salinigranum rubrum]